MNNNSIKVDVAVLGSGPGGISAAVAAARQGADVVIVERMGYLGGNLVSGLPLLGYLDAQGRQVTGGLAQELVDRLAEMGGTWGHRRCPFHNSTTNINPLYLRIILFELMKEHNIKVLLHCEVTGTNVVNGKLESVKVTGKGKEIEIEAKVFVDGTGDGDVAYMAGARYHKGQEGTGVMQPPTLMFNIGGIDFDAFFDYLEENPEELPYGLGLGNLRPGYDAEYFRGSPNHIFFGLKDTIKKLREEGKCPIDRDTLIYIRQPIHDQVAINTIRILNFDGSDVFDLSRGELESHLQIMPLVQMLQAHVPGFENCYLASISSSIGVRESRRFVGIKTLTEADVVSGSIPEDTVGLGSYVIDIHSGDGADTYLKTLDAYGIPYGCTVAADIDGLMLSGRCISVDAVAFGSTRIMPTLMAVGEGAGIGAAIAAKENISPRDVDVAKIREILEEQKAILSV